MVRKFYKALKASKNTKQMLGEINDVAIFIRILLDSSLVIKPSRYGGSLPDTILEDFYPILVVRLRGNKDFENPPPCRSGYLLQLQNSICWFRKTNFPDNECQVKSA